MCKVVYTFDFPRRSTVNLLSKNYLLNTAFSDYRGSKQQSAMMFLRSPKHFKAGKQIIFYFNRKLKYQIIFSKPNTSLLLAPNRILFNFFKNYAPRFYINEIFLNRISFVSRVTIKF